MNVYHNRNKTGKLKRWRMVKDKRLWALEALDGVNVSDVHALGAPHPEGAGVNSILVEPVYRRLLSIEKNGPIIIEIGGRVIGLALRPPFVVVMKNEPDFLEE